jgi:hypothetical protein
VLVSLMGEPMVLDFFPQHHGLDLVTGVVIRVHFAPDIWISPKVEHLWTS